MREMVLVAIATVIGVVVGQLPLTAWFTGTRKPAPSPGAPPSGTPALRVPAEDSTATAPLPARWVVVHRPSGDWSEVLLVLRTVTGTDVEETLVGDESHDAPGFNAWFETTMATARSRCALFNDALENLADAETVPEDDSTRPVTARVWDLPVPHEPAPTGPTGSPALSAGPAKITYTRL